MTQASELTQNVSSTVNIRTLSRPVWYMASPYSHPDPAVREARFKAVCMVAAQYLRQGVTVFSPIAHTHPLEVIGFDEAGVERPECDFWRDLDLPFMEMCCGCITLCLPGWDKSIGVGGEEKWFRKRQLPTVRDHDSWVLLPKGIYQKLVNCYPAPGEVIVLPDGTGEEKAITAADVVEGRVAFSPAQGKFVPTPNLAALDRLDVETYVGGIRQKSPMEQLDDEIPF